MKYEVVIPDWTEGKPLTVENVEADTPGRACEIVKTRFAPACPCEIMTVRACCCNSCSDSRHEAWRKEQLGDGNGWGPNSGAAP